MSDSAIAFWQERLETFGADLGLPDVTFDDQSYCAMGLDTGGVLHLEVQEGQLVLTLALGLLPEGARRLSVLETLLGANAFWIGTAGGTLSVDAEAVHVLYQRRVSPADAQAAGLTEVIGTHLETAVRWQALLESPVPEEEQSPLPPHGGGPGLRV
jgi:hypothetical protein